MRISKIRLLAELRRLLVRPDTRVVRRKLKSYCGKSSWDEITDENGTRIISNIVIMLDLRRDGIVTLTLHELLHVYMSIHLEIPRKLVLELEEAAILAWEKVLFDYLHAPTREKLLESWSNAINRKLVD